MRYSILAAVPLFLLAGALPTSLPDIGIQLPICPQLPVRGGGCVRCNSPSPLIWSAPDLLDVRGFDVTGVTTEIDLTFPQIQSECDCIAACLASKGTCNNYVYKFSTPASVQSGHRTCTLCTLTPAYPINNF